MTKKRFILPKALYKKKRIRKSRKDYFRGTSEKASMGIEQANTLTMSMPYMITILLVTIVVAASTSVFFSLANLHIRIPIHPLSFFSLFVQNFWHTISHVTITLPKIPHISVSLPALSLPKFTFPTIAFPPVDIQTPIKHTIQAIAEHNPLPWIQQVATRLAIAYVQWMLFQVTLSHDIIFDIVSILTAVCLFMLRSSILISFFLRHIMPVMFEAINPIPFLARTSGVLEMILLYRVTETTRVITIVFLVTRDCWNILEDVSYATANIVFANTCFVGTLLLQLSDRFTTVCMHLHYMFFEKLQIVCVTSFSLSVNGVIQLTRLMLQIAQTGITLVWQWIISMSQTWRYFVQMKILMTIQLAYLGKDSIVGCYTVFFNVAMFVAFLLWDILTLIGDVVVYIITTIIHWIWSVLLTVKNWLDTMVAAISAFVHQFDPLYEFIGNSVVQSLSDLFAAMGQTLATLSAQLQSTR